MPTCDCNTNLSYDVLRCIRRLGPRMRRGAVKALQDRLATKGTLLNDDIAECIALAWDMMESDVESRVTIPAPDANTVEAALVAAREGRVSTIDQILDALP